jgi:hypothetical protein
MGKVYRKCEPRKQKGRYIYNRHRLHKVGWTPKHKEKYRCLMKYLDSQINELQTVLQLPEGRDL